MPRRRAIAAAPVAVTVVIVGALAGCSTGSPTSVPTSPTSSAAVTTTASQSATSTDTGTANTASTANSAATATGPGTPTATATSTAPAPTATATPAAPALAGALPTEFTQVGQVIKDDALGHEIAVLRMARGLPWPTGSTGQSAAFELLALEMRWTPGTKYTASLREVDVALITGSQFPNRPDPLIDEQLAAAGWALLPAEVPAGQTATGWLVFKVDPKAATSIRLDYTRPEIAVKDTKTRFPKKVFSLQLVG
mgnify:CR=1 FL=1|jgi:hypothetical protein